ncbi:MAG: hypothetical protein KZQ75_05335 [Candidatus Thiodiazotropha sp. (ex Myrtea spinifera)]|nr:hypothetical protein [Candidatus Thiodiazotropha sp. (ex Myrtea spinifera)]
MAMLNRSVANLVPIFLICVFLTSCGQAKSRFSPLVVDKFFFNNEGEVREYVIRPKRLSITEVYIRSDGNSLLRNQIRDRPFEWKIKASVMKDGSVIEEKYLFVEAFKYHGAFNQYVHEISFNGFESFAFEMFPSEIVLVLTVEKADPLFLLDYKDVFVCIRASPRI